jgi:Raf kinase inhibitor-like YbhB/YbcL family protein
MADLAGTWTFRSFNPTLVTENLTPEENALIFADARLTLRDVPDPIYLEGTIEWQGGGLNLNGTRVNWGHYESFDIVGTGRPNSQTAGWEYHYHGIKTPRWSQADGAVDQRPTVVGSVFRVKDHNGRPGGWRSPAGYVASFIAVKPQTTDWGLTGGSWTYRSFHNEAAPVYGAAPPPANRLILQEAVFKLETTLERGITTLRGKIELPGGRGALDIRQGILPARAAGEPPSFEFVGTGGSGTQTGWEYRYDGHLTRWWPQGDVDQRAALVGSVVVRAAPFPTPHGYVYPFIAVKRSPMTLTSTAFQQNGDIPSKYTCDGEAGVKDVSPPLAWEGVPNGAKSLVLIMDDPDAPDPNAPERVWVHWVVYNIPPDTRSLPENAGRAGLPQGALHGRNDWAGREPPDPRAAGYGGPCPPIGRHRYFHKLYALDIKLDLRDATKSQIVQAMRGHVLANAEPLIGKYPKEG